MQYNLFQLVFHSKSSTNKTRRSYERISISQTKSQQQADQGLPPSRALRACTYAQTT